MGCRAAVLAAGVFAGAGRANVITAALATSSSRLTGMVFFKLPMALVCWFILRESFHFLALFSEITDHTPLTRGLRVHYIFERLKTGRDTDLVSLCGDKASSRPKRRVGELFAVGVNMFWQFDHELRAGAGVTGDGGHTAVCPNYGFDQT